MTGFWMDLTLHSTEGQLNFEIQSKRLRYII